MNKSHRMTMDFTNLTKNAEKLLSPGYSHYFSKANEQTQSMILKALSIHNLLKKARYGRFHQPMGGKNVKPSLIGIYLLIIENTERNISQSLNLLSEGASFFSEKTICEKMNVGRKEVQP